MVLSYIEQGNEIEFKEYLIKVFDSFAIRNKKVLVIIPDNTRSVPLGRFFKTFYELYRPKLKSMDYIIALGTHPPLNEENILKRLGITRYEWNEKYTDVKVYNHRWQDKNVLSKIGIIKEDVIEEISRGMLKENVVIEINRMIFTYDHLIVIGPVFPHEIIGFSGYTKYLFPGISGSSIIDVTHWLGALETNLEIIGKADTGPRKLINLASELVKIPVTYFNLVIEDHSLRGVYVGEDIKAWKEAVNHSSKVNIKILRRRYKKVLSLVSDKYDDYWTGAKAFYKLEPIIDDGGEIIIYAPHICEVSKTHRKTIEKIGFHLVDYYLTNWEEYKNYSKTVLAYSTYVKGTGKYEKGIEKPRVEVKLATSISEELCNKLNIGYEDPLKIDLNNYEKNEEILVVKNAGEILYKCY